MNETIRAELEIKSTELRADLKCWENEWASSHNGSKPGREDIKRTSDIAQKYKDYNKIRDVLAGRAPVSSTTEPRPKKRSSDTVQVETPHKRVKHTETPSKNRSQSDELMGSPAISRKLFSPKPVTALGPTPQRDGRVLGLFDLLVERELGTPSRSKLASPQPGSRGMVATTPRKRLRSQSIDNESPGRYGRTPMSTSKRQLLNDFMTPLKKRNEHSLAGRTPTSVSKLQFDTPAFLKRHSLSTAAEDGVTEVAVSSLRLPRKPFARGLSEIVASLRKVEEEVFDDDEAALREMEREELGGGSVSLSRQAQQVDVLVPDSQVQTLPLDGFDEAIHDSITQDRNANPPRVWKKKGQKRTTRLVKSRPTRIARPEKIAEVEEDSDEDQLLAAETQYSGPQITGDAADQDFGSDFEDVDGPDDTQKKKKSKKKKEKAGGKEGMVKKTVRKVNELAHANFQRLKLRNNGAKGGPGYGSKFRRRR